MDEAAEFFIITFVSLFLGWYLYRWTLFNVRGFPPGPIGYPFVGFVHLLFGEPHKVLAELSNKYGKVFSLYFGPEYTVVITDYEIAKEIVSHPAALSRPQDVFDFIPEKGGFAGTNGAEWQEQRRFCMSTMRNLGMGRGQWENLTKEHVFHFIKELSSWKGKPHDVYELLLTSLSSNNIALLIGRKSSNISKTEIQFVKKVNMILSEHFAASNLTVLVPWLPKYLVQFHIGGYHKRKQTMNEFANMFRKEIEKHMQSTELEHSDDFIGCYLKEMEKQNASNTPHYFSVDHLVGHLIVLFFAGTDTTISSIHWLLLLIASYPEIQKKVQAEINEVAGTDGQVGWDDRKMLPYTMATILEMERYVAINRLFPPRIAAATFECSGYTIPKESRIVVNSWAVMHDPNYWDKPMEFIPERFIRADGKDSSKTKGVSTFSFGRRNCPGDTVAMMTIFIYFTAVMQKFVVKTPSGNIADLRDGPFGAVTSPVPQDLCFIEK